MRIDFLDMSGSREVEKGGMCGGWELKTKKGTVPFRLILCNRVIHGGDQRRESERGGVIKTKERVKKRDQKEGWKRGAVWIENNGERHYTLRPPI